MRNAKFARTLGLGALAAALLLTSGCRDNAASQSTGDPRATEDVTGDTSGTGGAGAAGTSETGGAGAPEAPEPGTGGAGSPATDMSGRPATGNTESGVQEGGSPSPASDSTYGGMGGSGPITPDEMDMMPDDYRDGWRKDGAQDNEKGSEPTEEEKGSPGVRTPPGHELETR